MEFETLTDITVAIFTAGAVFVSLYLARKSQRNEVKAQHKQRISDVATKTIEQLAELRAVIIPYWSDEKTEKREDLVNVHRAVELIIAHNYQIKALLNNKTFDNGTSIEAKNLQAISDIADASAICLYLSLVNKDNSWKVGYDVQDELFSRVHEDFIDNAKDFVIGITASNSPNYFADKITEKSIYELESKLSAYLTSF
ncbi:MAG: hypothetical protein QM613_01345 [Micrococcaceae bacterium]